MRRRLLLQAALIATAAVAAACAGAASSQDTSCKGSQLAGTFKVVRGSAGAGNIVYALVLRNVSTSRCTVTGLPQGRLLSKAGKPLPTHIRAAFPGALSAVLVRLAPGKTTQATARFSPDVPGPGEGSPAKQCEPTAWWFRVAAPGGGTTKVRLSPPTPVCSHGALQLSAYTAPR